MEGLGMSFKKMYINRIRTRYLSTDKISKSRILDEYVNICGYHRKHAIRAINTPTAPTLPRPKPGPKPKYPEQQILALYLRHL